MLHISSKRKFSSFSPLFGQRNNSHLPTSHWGDSKNSPCKNQHHHSTLKDDDFSQSWIASDSIDDSFDELTEDIEEGEVEFRTVNTSDPDRVFHHFEKWECQKAGFYASKVDGKTKDQCEKEYADYLSDLDRFREGLEGVISEWKYSCEHYLTNKAMNRIAWLGQAAMCYSTGIPSKYCAGFNQLSEQQQEEANLLALEYLNKWFESNNRPQIYLEEALSIGRQVNIY